MLATLALLLLSAPSHATVPDKYGHGARALGTGGGGVALVEDGFAARMNPAGLARIRRPVASAGLSAAIEDFHDLPDLWWDTNQDGSLDARDEPLSYSSDVDDAIGAHLSLGRQIGGKFGVGLAMYVPTARLLRFSTFEPSLPSYFMHVNRPQRYTLALGVGGKILPGVSVGASIDFLSSARFTLVMTASANMTGEHAQDAESVEDLIGDITIDIHELNLDLVPRMVPILGVQLEVGDWVPALDGLVLGAAWRGSATLQIVSDLYIQGNVSVEDIGDLEPYLLALVADARLQMFDHYVPSMLTLGVAWRTDETLSGYVDARYTNWREANLNITQLEHLDITSPLVDVDDLVTDGNAYDVTLRPVWSVRTGVELALPRWDFPGPMRYLRLRVRGGFGWEPTPLLHQGENTSLLDSDRTLFSLGAGAEVWDPFALVDGPVRVDGFFQYHILAEDSLHREATEPTPGYPVDATSIPIGGSIYLLGAEASFEY